MFRESSKSQPCQLGEGKATRLQFTQTVPETEDHPTVMLFAASKRQPHTLNTVTPPLLFVLTNKWK